MVLPLLKMLNKSNLNEWLSFIDVIRTHHAKDVVSMYVHMPSELRSMLDSDYVTDNYTISQDSVASFINRKQVFDIV
ncbi:MAG TPA: hypothetical protein DIU06_05095 [Rhodospirillaceae bacterium]|nr:hypothetical protein [Rhodospirillaceae bacterium]